MRNLTIAIFFCVTFSQNIISQMPSEYTSPLYTYLPSNQSRQALSARRNMEKDFGLTRGSMANKPVTADTVKSNGIMTVRNTSPGVGMTTARMGRGMLDVYSDKKADIKSYLDQRRWQGGNEEIHK